MSRVPTPLTWKRRTFAVLEPRGLHRLDALAVKGIVAGPFAIYPSPYGAAGPFTLVHLPSQARMLELRIQSALKQAAEEFAALDLNWWTCDPKELIGPDLQALRNAYRAWLPPSSIGTGKIMPSQGRTRRNDKDEAP